MRRLLIVGTAIAGVLLVLGYLVGSGGQNWARMIERMPDTAPPKWMFNNIGAIRQNTDRILELLDEGVPTGERRPGTAA